MNYIYVKQLPILSPQLIQQHQALLNTLLLELVYTAWDMKSFAEDLLYRGPPFRWCEARRPRMRAELDALLFHLYGISRNEADYIIETFPIVKRKDEQAHGEFRTKRLILDRYDTMTNAFVVTHGSLSGTPNGSNPPLDLQSLETYSRRLAEALAANYHTNLDPPPAHPSQTHPSSTRPSWNSPRG